MTEIIAAIKEVFQDVIQAVLEVEMDVELDRKRCQRSETSMSQTTTAGIQKREKLQSGKVDIKVSRERNGNSTGLNGLEGHDFAVKETSYRGI